MALDRRRFFSLVAGGLATAAQGAAARAAPGLAAEDGSPMRSFTLADPAGLIAKAGLQRFGAAAATVELVEAFDYNCGYCRAGARDLDALLRDDPSVALRPLHLAILSPASLAAARVQIAVDHRWGETAARALHVALLGTHGLADGEKALALARDLGSPVTPEAMAAADGAIRRQIETGRAAGLRMTPTFVIGTTAFVGWPGRRTIETFLGAARRCREPVCA